MHAPSWLRVAAVALSVAVAVVTATPARAHIGLMSSAPADGQVLDVSPEKVRLAFYSSVSEPARVLVTAPDGTRLQTGQADVTGYLVTQDVRSSTRPGTYRIDYSVRAGNHQDIGVVVFNVGSVNTLGSLRVDRTDTPSGTPDTSRLASIGVVAAALSTSVLLVGVGRRRNRGTGSER